MTTPGIDIRPAMGADREQVLTLLRAQYVEHAIVLHDLRLGVGVDGVLHGPERGSLLLAWLDGVAVALAYVSITWALEHGGKTAWLEELYVVPERREQGIGGALLTAARAFAAAQGCAAIDLEVDVEHQRAAHLYAREGFEPVTRTRWVLRLHDPGKPHP